MTNVIVLFPKIEDAENIRNLLVRRGFCVPAVCTTGAQALAAADSLGDGIVVCGYKYADMLYSELADCLPSHFEMLLVVSRSVFRECSGSGIVCVSMPLKAHELLNTLEMMVAEAQRRKKKQKKLQKCSMDSGTDMVETAQMVLSMMSF